ncbi:hypothetical protein K402DRAFT_399113 [Aulographum hederae CBS 113979]|uniref:RNase H type-1 domain-containing protein n=1 Tax=Aulographum hederae CBS 113979 TaxID=1176131 RepID=A0A6G1GJA7_9PEZI|nr:hypothetical protein K402DRAFT_399113 [Aulographum hederae CBS 113979]
MDDAYVVKTMTEDVLRWRENGWIEDGREAPNADVLKTLEKNVKRMNERGIEVLFWEVPKTENLFADHLANEAFSF